MLQTVEMPLHILKWILTHIRSQSIAVRLLVEVTIVLQRLCLVFEQQD